MRTSLGILICSVATSIGCGQKSSPAHVAAPQADVIQSKSAVASDPKKQDSAQTPTPNSAEAVKPNRIDELFALMRAADMEKSCETLLMMSEQDLKGASSIARLWNMSEEQFKQLSEVDSASMQQEVIFFTSQLSALKRHCMLKGEELLKGNNYESARQHFEAVLRLGQAVSAPNRLMVLQSLGKLWPKQAEEGISRSMKK